MNKSLSTKWAISIILVPFIFAGLRWYKLQSIKEKIENDRYIWIIEVDNDWYQSENKPNHYGYGSFNFTDLNGKKVWVKNYRVVHIYKEEKR